jgi:hypothetical protein
LACLSLVQTLSFNRRFECVRSCNCSVWLHCARLAGFSYPCADSSTCFFLLSKHRPARRRAGPRHLPLVPSRQLQPAECVGADWTRAMCVSVLALLSREFRSCWPALCFRVVCALAVQSTNSQSRIPVGSPSFPRFCPRHAVRDRQVAARRRPEPLRTLSFV